jgi:hypothetical protein
MSEAAYFAFHGILKDDFQIGDPHQRFPYAFPLRSMDIKLVTQKHICQYFASKKELEEVFDLSVFQTWWWSDELNDAMRNNMNNKPPGAFAYTEDDLIAFGRYVTQRPITYQDVYLWKKEEKR